MNIYQMYNGEIIYHNLIIIISLCENVIQGVLCYPKMNYLEL